MRYIIAVLAFVLIAAPVSAQQVLPVPPPLEKVPALQIFAEESDAKIEFVSRQYGVDMWVATKGDVVQVIHTTPDGRGMLMNGFLFAPDGTLVTEQSLKDYAEGKGSIVLEKAEEIKKEFAPQTPSAKLWADLGETHYVEFGSQDKPTLYTFVDPFCPHCKLFWENIASYVSQDKVNLRLIPVAILGQQSANAASYIVSQPDRAQAWLGLTARTLDAKLFTGEAGLDKITENFAMMQKWQMQSTPISVYKDPEGKVKMYRGNPDDMATLLAELGIQ